MSADRQSRAIDRMALALGPAFEKGDIELAKATIIDCCRAVRRVRGGKDPVTGSYRYEDEPDYPIRLAASVKVMEWAIGKPIARSINADVSPTGGGKGGDVTGGDLLELLLASPDAAIDILDKLKRAASKAKPLEITVSPDKTQPPESQSEGLPR